MLSRYKKGSKNQHIKRGQRTMKNLLLIAVIIAFSAASVVSETFSQEKTPVRGGILREIQPNGPKSLSYYPEMGPGESGAVLPAAEKLME